MRLLRWADSFVGYGRVISLAAASVVEACFDIDDSVTMDRTGESKVRGGDQVVVVVEEVSGYNPEDSDDHNRSAVHQKQEGPDAKRLCWGVDYSTGCALVHVNMEAADALHRDTQDALRNIVDNNTLPQEVGRQQKYWHRRYGLQARRHLPRRIPRVKFHLHPLFLFPNYDPLPSSTV